jgi:hypothetical protein
LKNPRRSCDEYISSDATDAACSSARPSLAKAKTLDQRLLVVDGVMFDAEPV